MITLNLLSPNIFKRLKSFSIDKIANWYGKGIHEVFTNRHVENFCNIYIFY